MSILIKGMEMPKSPSEMICVFSDGTAVKYFNAMMEHLEEGKAIPVPDHGRLIDADALYEECTPIGWDGKSRNDYVCAITGHQIKNAPTIIPADKEDV